MHHLRGLGYGMVRAARGLCRNPVAGAKIAIVLMIAFSLVGVAHLLQRTVLAGTSTWRGVHMVVYLEEGTTPERAQQVRDALAQVAALERSVYIPPEQALERLRDSLGDHDGLLDGVEAGMLPASIEITLHQGMSDVAAAYPVVSRLEATPGVQEVEFAGEWVGKVSMLLTGIRYGGWALLLVMGIACMTIVITAIRSRLSSRGEEARVMHLLGASDAFVRGPLLLEGAAYGVLGVGLAAILMWSLFRGYADVIRSALNSLFGDVPLLFFSASQLVLFVALGAALGLAGGWVATRRHGRC